MGMPPVTGLSVCEWRKERWLIFVRRSAQHINVKVQYYTNTRKARDKTTQARKHSTEGVCEESEAVEEYSRKRAVMTPHSPDPLTPLPPLPAQQRI